MTGSPLSATTFGVHIIHVVFLCAKKKMSGINAGWIVALMKYIQAGRDRSMMQFPTNVRGDRPHFTAAWGGPKHAAPHSSGCCGPRPTFAWTSPVNFFPEAVCDWTRWLKIHVMTTDKAKRLTFDESSLAVGPRRYWRGLTASAHAETGWIGRFWYGRFASIMTAYEAMRMAFDYAISPISQLGYFGLLSTTTVAVTEGNRGIIGVHGNLSFLCQSRGRLQRRSAISIGFTPVSIPQVSA